MKKIVVALFIVVMLFTIAGCSDDLQSVLERIRETDTEPTQQEDHAGSGSAQSPGTEASQPTTGADTPQPTTANDTPAPEPVSEPPQAPTMILTVDDIRLSGMTSIERIDFINEDGRAVDMSADWNDWFTNATVVGSIMLNGAVNMQLSGSTYVYTPSDGYVLSLPFVVDGEEFMIGVCIGARFVVREENGGYALVPEETILLSPAPPPPEPAVALIDAHCELWAIRSGNMAFNPLDGDVCFIVNNVTQSDAQIVTATNEHMTMSLSFELNEPVSAETRLCLYGDQGGYVEWSQKLQFGSGEQKLEAVINARAPVDSAYEVEIYFDDNLVFSDHLELQ